MAGFVFSAFSAALCLFSILSIWHAANIDLGGNEGGSAFSANMSLLLFPLLASVVGIALGALGAMVTFVSLWIGRYAGWPSPAFHLASMALLIPAAFLLYRIIIR